jgi:LPS export ABC transporter protein LptC
MRRLLLSVPILLCSLPARAAPPPAPDMPEAIQGFRWATRDPKTGQVTMILAGKSAVTTKGGPIDVKEPTITFFDRPPTGTSLRPPVPSTTTLTAEHGDYHRDTGLLSLKGKVVVTRSDGTAVRTETLEWSDAEGRFWTESPAELSDGNSVISGIGLKGEMVEAPGVGRTLDRITLARDVKTVLTGTQLTGLDDFFATVSATAGPGGVTITCGGGMTYLRRAAMIDYTEGVLAKDAAQRELASRSLSLELGPDRRISRLVATGGVRIKGPNAEEAAGETFSWDAASARAVLSGAPYVRVEQAGGTLRAAGVVHDRPAGRTEFTGPGVIELPPPPPPEQEEAPHAP